MKLTFKFLTFISLLSGTLLLAVDGVLDPSFNPSGTPPGTVFTDFDGGDDEAFAVVVQPDQKIVVGGLAFDSSITEFVFGLARYNIDGSLDSSFGIGGKVVTPQFVGATDSEIFGLALQPDGRIVAVGSATIGGVDNFAVARYLPNGTLDPSFAGVGQVVTLPGTGGFALSVIILPTGNIIAGGFGGFVGLQEFMLINYLPTGLLDPVFGLGTGMVHHPIIVGENSGIEALALQPDNLLVAAGRTETPGVVSPAFALARYDSITGALDTANFNSPDGFLFTTFPGPNNAFASAVKIQPDGKIIAAGWSDDQNFLALARYCNNGTLDDGINCGPDEFGSGGFVETSLGAISNQISGMALQQNGKIVIGGTVNDGASSILVGRYNTDGSVDSATFNPSGVIPGFNFTQVNGASTAGFAVALQANERIIVVGETLTGIGLTLDFAVVRYNNTLPCPLLQTPRSDIVQAIMNKYCIC